MSFTDLFIRRPVLACVVSLVILIAGIQAIKQAPDGGLARSPASGEPDTRTVHGFRR